MALAVAIAHYVSVALFFLPLFGVGDLVDKEVPSARFLQRDLVAFFAGDALFKVLGAAVPAVGDHHLGFLIGAALYTWANALFSGKARGSEFTFAEKLFLYLLPVKILLLIYPGTVLAIVEMKLAYIFGVKDACASLDVAKCLKATIALLPLPGVPADGSGVLKVALVGVLISMVGGIVVMAGGHKGTMEFPTSLSATFSTVKVDAGAKSVTVSADIDVADDEEEEEEDEDVVKPSEEAELEAMEMLSYAELRDWAKSVGIRANQKKAELIAAILAHEREQEAE
uniref:SAP domain-containing protein n=1 Tax=Phaeomonas parva TaxID=124430 RepID=A0A6U4EJF0_9STRA